MVLDEFVREHYLSRDVPNQFEGIDINMDETDPFNEDQEQSHQLGHDSQARRFPTVLELKDHHVKDKMKHKLEDEYGLDASQALTAIKSHPNGHQNFSDTV